MAKKPRRGRVVVTGIKEIDRKLRKLEPKVQGKIARKAAREGLRPIHKEVIATAPEDTGFLKAQIKLRSVKKKRRGEIALHVVVPSFPFQAAYTGNPSPGSRTTAFYPSIIEYGSRNRPPNPWIRRAYDRLKLRGRHIMIERLRSGVLTPLGRGVRKPR